MSKRVWTGVLGLFLVLGLMSSTAWAGAAKGQTAKTKDIYKLMKLTGAADLGMQVMDQMMDAFSRNMPKVPANFWVEFRKEVDPKHLVDMVVPIYDKHLTHADIKALIQFYQSPVGKKLIKVLPQITQESMAAGEVWGRQVAERAVAKLKAKGYR